MPRIKPKLQKAVDADLEDQRQDALDQEAREEADRQFDEDAFRDDDVRWTAAYHRRRDLIIRGLHPVTEAPLKKWQHELYMDEFVFDLTEDEQGAVALIEFPIEEEVRDLEDEEFYARTMLRLTSDI